MAIFRYLILCVSLFMAGCAWNQGDTAAGHAELERNQQLHQEASALRQEIRQKQTELDALKEQ